MINQIQYWLSEQPLIVAFRWSTTDSLGATWSFLVTSISAYITASVTLHLLLLLLRNRRPIALGPIPVLHSLIMALASITIFAGILSSAVLEIRDTRWIWRRSKTPFQWLLCFPLGTRSSGRVFFWSYIFYLSRFLHIFRTFFTILRHRQLPYFQIFNHSVLIFMSFLWLEFSQSFQVMAILSMTLVFSVVYGYRFWTEIGFRRVQIPVVMNMHFALLLCNLICHVLVLFMHLLKGGCNGIGAWVFNSMLNSVACLLFLRFYFKYNYGKTVVTFVN